MDVSKPHDPKSYEHPVCFAQPGARCTQPTNTGRSEVSWFHMKREELIP